MELIEYKDAMLGGLSIRPKCQTSLPLFKHLTGGYIAVKKELWENEYDLVAAMHGVSCSIERQADKVFYD